MLHFGQKNIITVLIIQAVFATLLFLYGFFPLKVPDGQVATMDDVPSYIGNISFPDKQLYKPVIRRLVIMVIDALRWDFANRLNMPYVSSLVELNEACLLKGKADPPTVTMPRIKALVTGTVPNFVDVVLNLGSKEMREDSIISQAVSNKLKTIFYGDDTWLKLFPHSFARSEGTSSFFVTDFTEVDDNVTRHIASELSAVDWDIMVLHYLGLDHIGHLEGPASPKVRPKLLEMDAIARQIHTHLRQWSLAANQSAAVVICGDHGMKDSGSHGGASLAEVLVPILTLGLNCPGSSAEPVGQIDVAPTLSVLLGLPIPAGSIGRLVPSLLHALPTSRQLHTLHYNAQLLAARFRHHLPSHSTHGGWLAYEDAVRLHSKWLESGGHAEDATSRRARSLYSLAAEEMSRALADSLVEFDVYLLVVASIILAQVCLLLLVDASWSGVGWRQCLLFALLLSWNAVFCAASQCRSLLCSATSAPPGVVVVLLSCVLMASNSVSLVCNAAHFKPKLPTGPVPVFLVAGTLLQACSLASSSFVEEEHQVWYLLWPTLLVLASRRSAPARTLAVLAAHRLLRKLNQTGDKWASLPDLHDWLSLSGHESLHLAVFAAGLFGVLCWCCHLMASKERRVLCFVAVSCVFCYRAAVRNINILGYPQSRGVVEARVFWGALSLLVLLGGRGSEHDPQGTLAGCWALVSALLHRPHNVVLVPAQVLFTAHIQYALEGEHVRWSAFAHVWLGMLFYFYQGNSNSFASIDVAAGYVGLQDYQPYVVGVLLTCHTYCAPVFSHLLLLRGLRWRKQWHQHHIRETCRVLACSRLLPLAMYAVLVTWQRYHLFVWTVFSPKLLYECAHTAVTSIVLLITLTCSQVAGVFSLQDSLQCQRVPKIKWPEIRSRNNSKNY